MASKKAADAHWAAENPGVPDPKPAFQQVISNKAMSTFQMMMSSRILLPSMILMGRCCKNPQIWLWEHQCCHLWSWWGGVGRIHQLWLWLWEWGCCVGWGMWAPWWELWSCIRCWAWWLLLGWLVYSGRWRWVKIWERSMCSPKEWSWPAPKRTQLWATKIMKQFVIKPKCCEYG